MTDEAILAELEAVAYKLRIEVIYESLETRGGLCKVKGKKLILINKNLLTEEKVRLLSSELSKFDTEHLFMLPKIREVLAQNTQHLCENLPSSKAK